MQFIKYEDLKIGMRLARPIYNKKGVLLFERNSKLSAQAIDSVRNFGLLGIYVLDQAEPLPPLSEEDIAFERFQTQSVFSIKEEIEKILSGVRKTKIEFIINSLINEYGHYDGKMNFYQYLRSKEDYVYRHAFNVAVLCTLMSRALNMRFEEQKAVVAAALLHDIGKINIPADQLFRDVMTPDQQYMILNSRNLMNDVIEHAVLDGIPVKRICMQELKVETDFLRQEKNIDISKMTLGAKILLVANRFDELTAMDLSGHAESEVKALLEFKKYPEVYDKTVVNALVKTVNTLFPGVSVVLSTGEEALVLAENTQDILKPTVLCFKDNSVLDLGLKVNWDIQIVDVVKTLDNRYVMNTEAIQKFGLK